MRAASVGLLLAALSCAGAAPICPPGQTGTVYPALAAALPLAGAPQTIPALTLTSRLPHSAARQLWPEPASSGAGVCPPGEVCLYRPAAGPPRLPVGLRPLVFPNDLGRAWRADPEFAPFFLPEVYPAAQMDTLMAEAYYNSPQLSQRGLTGNNPFVLAREQVERMERDPRSAQRRLAQAAALTLLYHLDAESPRRMVDLLLATPKYVKDELAAQIALPGLARILPRGLTAVQNGDGLVPTDMAVLTHTTFNSVTPVEPLLLQAARRGLKAIVIADQGRIDGAQQASEVAARLQREGRLPADFTVITGESIQTTAGGVIAACLRQRVPEQMTMGETVRVIHSQGGLAYLAHPGLAGGTRLLRDLNFDGYLIRAGFFEMVRTLSILYDPRLKTQTPLYGSVSLYSAGVGMPYSLIEAQRTRPEVLRRALSQQQAYAAGNLYLPYMGAIALKPIGLLLRFLNMWFVGHDNVELALSRAIHADNVQLNLSWDREVQAWMNLGNLPSGVEHFLEANSPLTRTPEVLFVSVEYGPARLNYNLKAKETTLQSVVTW